MLLPIESNPSIQAYAHHAFTMAILENEEHIGNEYFRFCIDGYERNAWETNLENAEFQHTEEGRISLYGKEYATSVRGLLYRKCGKRDSLVVKLEKQMFSHGDSVFSVSISPDDFVEAEQIRNPLFTVSLVRRNGMYIVKDSTFCNEKIVSWEIGKYPIWLKVEKDGNEVKIFLAYEEGQWQTVMVQELSEIYGDNCCIGVSADGKYNQFYDWYFSNYVQLYCDSTVEIVGWMLSMDYYNMPNRNYKSQYVNHFLEYQYEKYTDAILGFGSVLEYVKWKLRCGKYVELWLDEYYVRGRASYRKEHYEHGNLIYGYDEVNKKILMLGFGSRAELGEMNEDDFASALNLKKYEGRVCSITDHPNNIPFHFSIERFKEQLYEYANGIDTSVHDANVLTMKSGIYGRKIYDFLLDTKKGLELLFKDIRVGYIICEHNMIMKQRLRFLISRGYIDREQGTVLERDFDIVCRKSEELKLLLMKGKAVGISPEKVCNKLREIAKEEDKFYPKLLSSL